MVILIGHHSTSDYKLFDVENKRVVTIQDVVFDEIKQLQQTVTDYVKVVTSYNFENSDSAKLGSAKMPIVEAQIEENMRRSTRKKDLPERLQDCELFQDNKVNDDSDFVHFAPMAEFEPVKIEEALSDPKWICEMKENLESIEKSNT